MILETSPIVPGAWVETSWGEAVALAVRDGWVSFRYEATRSRDGATLWVKTSETLSRVKWLRGPDAVSAYVLALRGAYGYGVCNDGKIPKSSAELQADTEAT